VRWIITFRLHYDVSSQVASEEVRDFVSVATKFVTYKYILEPCYSNLGRFPGHPDRAFLCFLQSLQARITNSNKSSLPPSKYTYAIIISYYSHVASNGRAINE
jgi:hypothetical protein